MCICSLPHSRRPCRLNRGEAHHRLSERLVPKLQPASHTHTHTHTHTERRGSTSLLTPHNLLLHLFPGSVGLQCSALLWPAAPFTLTVFMLSDAVFIQVLCLKGDRERLRVEEPGAVFVCILHLVLHGAFQTNNSFFIKSLLSSPNGCETQNTDACTLASYFHSFYLDVMTVLPEICHQLLLGPDG